MKVMGARKYHYLIIRVEYPREGGYRMEPSPLPDWIHIHIVDEGGSRHLLVHSRIHVNREVKVGPSYSSSFTDQEIIKDLSGEVSHRFLN